MKTLKLTYDNKAKGFNVREPRGFGGGETCFIPAPKSERNDVIEYLARSLCNNPAMQARFGILGEGSFDIS